MGLGELLPVEIHGPVLEVARDKGDGLGIIAVGQGDAAIGRAARGCRDTGYDLEGYPLGRQGVDLLAAPAKDEGIATLEAQYPMTGLGQIGEQAIDFLLTHDMVVPLLADINALRIATSEVEDGLGYQAVMDDYIGLLHEAQGAKGNQVWITRPGADQINLTHAAMGAGFGKFPRHDGIGLLKVARKDTIGDSANQDPIPESAAVPLIGKAVLDGISIAGA